MEPITGYTRPVSDEGRTMFSYLSIRTKKLRFLISRTIFPEVHDELDRVVERSNIDAMTGFYGWSAFKQAAARVAEDPGLAIVMADINHLKQVNDRISYDRGDEVIRTAAYWMAGVAEHEPFGVPAGMMFRRGGDEFAFIISADNAEQLVAALEGWAMPHKGRNLVTTLSAGSGPTEAAAEAAMKRAKLLDKQVQQGVEDVLHRFSERPGM